MSFRKVVLSIAIFICSLLLAVFILISPITKYVIESKSEELTGRKIEIESLWINIFSGSIHIENFKLFEFKSDQVFVKFADFYCDVDVFNALSGDYVISPITLTNSEINIIQSANKFNFDDLVERFTDTTAATTNVPSEPVRYFINNISLKGGNINYTTTTPKASISVLNLNVSSTPISYSDSIFDIQSDFSLKSGGEVDLNFKLNANSLDYGLQLKSEKYKLNFLAAYLTDVLKLQSFNAILNTDLNISGNLNRPQEVAAKGIAGITEFSVIDTTGDELSSFESYIMNIDSLNTRAGIYNFKYITLEKPHLKFGIYDDGTNFDRVVVAESSEIDSTASVEEYTNIFAMLAGYIKSLSTEYLLSEYSVEKLTVNHGHIIFTDYTLEDKFKYDLDSLSFGSDNLNSKNERILLSLSSRLNNSGFMSGTLSIDPDGFEDMDIHYIVKDLLISDINPYSKFYVATPFLDGKIMFENKTSVINNQLKSTNKLFIERIIVGNKTGTKGEFDLPIKLAVSILRDPKGNIDFDIPVEGDLNDPKFKIGKVIWQIFKNLIIKAATAPYKLIANAYGGKEDDYKEIRYQYFQKGLTAEQSATLTNLIKLLKEKPDLGIEFVQFNNKNDEKEQLAVFKAKMQFFGFTQDTLSEIQFQQIMTLSNKDSVFVSWVDNRLGSSFRLTSIHEKCIQHIGNENLITEVETIMEQRNYILLNYFTVQDISADRIKISNVKDDAQAAKESIPRYVINLFSYENSEAGTVVSSDEQP